MNWRKFARRFFSEWVKPIAIVVIVACSFRSAIADWNDVPTGSMKPTILEGDRIFVNKLAYDLRIPFTDWRLVNWGDPQRGDIVVFFSPDSGIRMVKRIIGIPGDKIAMRNNRLFVNGKQAAYATPDAAIVGQIDAEQRPHHRFALERVGDKEYPIMLTPGHGARRSFGPLTLQDGQYFAMGDNRDNSRDSRWFGFIPRDQIVGRVSRVALSLDPKHHGLPRWDRFLRPLP